ncbi:FAD/NAD(P)-binding domain-containing protein [Delitschia confertaspora ATCC 74209]|uniref:FAD/NAD(P)-binding domain-containing protein n=1 Tax=Delitschia confertaspora ATCC 74209 TaxID=1513339 RepID=A0A9P4JHX6_9PLEO|nr:FAD/NAD(P)-binding domain-containing protein [Delitschia confertaspora ATCC 74209]
MLSEPPKRVAIIGAGLSGLVFALALKRHGISSTVYELRTPDVTSAGALMLSPNALRILDKLGLYERLKTLGYNFEDMSFRNHDQEITDTYYLGQEKHYGYKALRIYRQVLVTELRAAAKNQGIPIYYGLKFSHVVSEDEKGVVFAFSDGTTFGSADILIGADGMHSKVRKHIAPDVAPKYSGVCAISCAAETSKIKFPDGMDLSTYVMPTAIYSKPGAWIMAPQDVDGSECLAGTQRAYPEQDRAGWDRLLADRDSLLELFRTGYEDWPEITQSVLDNVRKETMQIWPYYVVPTLSGWYSREKHVIILGDAAHAIPPTAGQGASQGFEDSFTLAALLPRMADGLPLDRVLEYWQNYRQKRIDKVMELTLQLNNSRLPQAEREKLIAEGQTWQSGSHGELAWLYNAQIEDDVLAWAEAETKKTKKTKKNTCPFKRI